MTEEFKKFDQVGVKVVHCERCHYLEYVNVFRMPVGSVNAASLAQLNVDSLCEVIEKDLKKAEGKIE